jgi:hypothetical protein
VGSCRWCEAELELGAAFCGVCGRQARPLDGVCPNCGERPVSGHRFCEYCGTPVKPTPRETSMRGQAREAPISQQGQMRASQQTSASLPYEISTGQRRRKRSAAWIYYAILSILCVIAAIGSSEYVALIGTALFGLYAFYLFRGGRIVIWFW